MTPKSLVRGAMVVATLAFLAGCSPHKGILQPIPPNTDPLVFDDTFGKNLDWQPFLNSKYDALAIDNVQHYSGTKSIRITVPGPGETGGYAGGAFVTSRARDLSGYNALTFWCKASRPVTMAVAGLGNDNTGTSLYDASRKNLSITTTWTKYTIPIPVPAKLSHERGMFYFAQAPDAQGGCQLWFDDLQFEVSPDLSNPRANFPAQAAVLDVGFPLTLTGTQALFDIGATPNQSIEMSSNYLTLISSDTTVAKNVNGRMEVVGAGTATITAKLGEIPAIGSATLTAIAAPSSGAPVPTVPAADAISIYSDAYSNHPVDSWSPSWAGPFEIARVQDVTVAGNNTKKFAAGISFVVPRFAAIDFATQTLDATNMTHLHLDVWMAKGRTFRIKVVDFGPNGVFNDPAVGPSDDSFHETLALNYTPHPGPPFLVLTPGAWTSLDIPLASMTNLTSRGHIAQIILEGIDGNGQDPSAWDISLPPVYLDNLYFHR